MDNGGLSPIESDCDDHCARGFFIQDITYGFLSLDGFVVWYNGQVGEYFWEQKSLIIPYDANEDLLSKTDLDLTTTYETNSQWQCEVSLDTQASPEFEQLYCTR